MGCWSSEQRVKSNYNFAKTYGWATRRYLIIRSRGLWHSPKFKAMWAILVDFQNKNGQRSSADSVSVLLRKIRREKESRERKIQIKYRCVGLTLTRLESIPNMPTNQPRWCTMIKRDVMWKRSITYKFSLHQLPFCISFSFLSWYFRFCYSYILNCGFTVLISIWRLIAR